MTKRGQIFAKYLAALQQIQLANGFATDAGQVVAVNEIPELGESDPDTAIAILAEPDTVVRQGEKVSIQWPITIAACGKVNPADPEAAWNAIENVLGDIKRAVELADRTLGGLIPNQFTRGQTRVIPRQPGGATIGVAITYGNPYWEGWGQP